MSDKSVVILAMICLELFLVSYGWSKYLDYKLEEIQRNSDIQRTQLLVEAVSNTYLQGYTQAIKILTKPH